MSVRCPTCSRQYPDGAVVCPLDGATLPGGDWIEPTAIARRSDVDRAAGLEGLAVDGYVFGRRLGEGGMGEVYAGEQPMIGKKVAIKVLKPEIAAQVDNVKRMLGEARAVNAIRHRGIVDIYNFGTLPDGRPYLVMEYLEGGALDTLLERQGRLNPLETCQVLEEVAASLAAAHGAGVVHRDLKPGNTFLVNDTATGTRFVKLLDFGLAKSQEVSQSGAHTATGMVVGTPAYMAPEQVRGAKVDASADLYALGVMAFELLTGRLPFSGDSTVELMMAHLQTPAPRVASQQADVPAELDALVAALLAKDPAQRPESADAVRRELKRIRIALREGVTQVRASAPRSPKREVPAEQAVTPKVLEAQSLTATAPNDEAALRRAMADTPTARPAPRRRAGPLLAGLVVTCAVVAGAISLVSGTSPPVAERRAPPAAAAAPPPLAARGPAKPPEVESPPQQPRPPDDPPSPKVTAHPTVRPLPPRRDEGPSPAVLAAALKKATTASAKSDSNEKLVKQGLTRVQQLVESAHTAQERQRALEAIKEFEQKYGAD